MKQVSPLRLRMSSNMGKTLITPPHLFIILITLASSIELSSSLAPRHPRLRALVTPITKDTLTALYSITLNRQSPFILDLTSPLSWSTCPTKHPTFPCSSPSCSAARSMIPPRCGRFMPIDPGPGPCTCQAIPGNPVTGECGFADLTVTTITTSTTNGRNPSAPVTVPDFVSSCAPSNVFKGLPQGTAGLAGLARSTISVSSQFSSKLSIRNQFAICLPSTGATGVAFFGDKPFYLLPPYLKPVSNLLIYTPLLKHPMNPLHYYVDLQAIAVNGEAVEFSARQLNFDSLGHGGVKFSTTAPYSTLRSPIYRAFLEAFAKATAGIRRAAAVEPFELCLNTTALGSTRVGYGVAQIDLVLAGGKNWTMFGSNSLMQVGAETACLAFVDGGQYAQEAVVIGGHQMENSLVVFDLYRSRLGFTSTLFGIMTTCGNFNFTVGV